MGLFRRKPATPAPQGNGEAPVIAELPRGDDLEVNVGGMKHRWEAVRSLAGNRPRSDDDYPEREKSVKVRLVREYNNQYDPNAVAVWSDKDGHVGYVPRAVAADLAPALDQILIAAAKGTPGNAVDIYCSADLYATWDEWDPDPEMRDPDQDKNEPDEVQLTLCLRLPIEVKVKQR